MADQFFSTNNGITEVSSAPEEVHVIIDLATYFEIDRCVEFIQSNAYQKVALQFPDELMSYAQYVSKSLEEKIGRKFFVLADTSYGSCCVDEVSAAHLGANAIIHFGHSCLSDVETLPVLFVFGRQVLDSKVFLHELGELFPDKAEKIILFCDVVFYYSLRDLTKIVEELYPNYVFAKVSCDHSLPNADSCLATGKKFSLLGRNLNLEFELNSYKVIYVGQDSRSLHNLMLTLNKNEFFLYNSCDKKFRKDLLGVNKALMRRYYLIERAKDAQIVGILMGTLAVKRYKEIVERIKSVLKHAGKKFYTFIVGKINVAKLANFMEIDIFVLVACPDNSLLDSKEFYKPVITPFELEIACLGNREWNGQFSTDFQDILPGSSLFMNIPVEEEEEPEYSLITGKLREKKRIEENHCSTDVMLRNNENQISSKQASSAVEYLSMRTWQGLQLEDGQTEVCKATDGRAGIAMSYVNKPSEKL